eukprot:54407-Alexandrium_andersonii.AAC.1
MPKRGSLSGGAVKAALSRLPRRFLGGAQGGSKHPEVWRARGRRDARRSCEAPGGLLGKPG